MTKKVVFIGAKFRPQDSSRSMAGKVTQEQICENLQVLGCEVQQYYLSTNKVFPRGKLFIHGSCQKNEVFYGYINLPVFKQVIFSGFVFLSLLFKRYDTMIVYNIGIFNFIPLIFNFITGRKTVAIVQDVIIPNENTGNALMARLDLMALSLVRKHISHPIPISSAINQHFFENRGLVIEGGITEFALKIYQDFQYLQVSGRFNVVYAGSLDLQNGIDLMIDAVTAIDPSLPVKLIVFGDGPGRNLVEKAAQQDSRIVFKGFVDQETLTSFLKQEADLLLNLRKHRSIDTSFFFPSKLIEYLSSGIPVLSTQFSSLPQEYVSHLNIVEEDAADVKRGILQVLQNQHECVARAKITKNWVVQTKTWQKRIEEMMNYLQHLPSTASGESIR